VSGVVDEREVEVQVCETSTKVGYTDRQRDREREGYVYVCSEMACLFVRVCQTLVCWRKKRLAVTGCV
jgi:hypothetical protein